MANFLIGVYLSWRCVLPLPVGRWGKLTIILFVIIFIEHHWVISQLFGTSIPSPELPRLVLMVLGAIYGALLLMAMCMVIRDAVGLVLLLTRRKTGRILLTSSWVTMGLLVICISTSLWGVWAAVKVPSVREVSIVVPGLSPQLDGYRIALLTDLHTSRLFQEPWIKSVVDKTNSLNPDVIAISGDLVDGTVADRKSDIAPLASLSAPDGVYAVAGNHEYYADYERWMDAFRGLGIIILENQHVVLRKEDGGFVLAGVPDEVAGSRGQTAPDITKALEGRPDGLPVVLLDHRPGHMRGNQAQGVDLQLSGHTHGGHIRGVDQIVRLFNDGFVSGLYQVNGSTLYVSNGAGLWPGFAIRIGRPSEITQLTLHAVLPRMATAEED
ncbi:metallophosphoesterase [Pseudomonas sp. NPDC089547]|uniref:metallophosphoesterase n=1 Tax=Pseudomonas sp. NPDC089547 TaxID=3390652 RepID=UPI003D0786B5